MEKAMKIQEIRFEMSPISSACCSLGFDCSGIDCNGRLQRYRHLDVRTGAGYTSFATFPLKMRFNMACLH